MNWMTTGAICESYCFNDGWVFIAAFIFLLWALTLIVLSEKNNRIKELMAEIDLHKSQLTKPQKTRQNALKQAQHDFIRRQDETQRP